ncbi:MAG: DUF4058 family protein [Gemmataceae bacterium]
MPVHDWTRVGAGVFHHFHLGWIDEIQRALNGGLLPREFYALAEQFVGPFGPDVLTLQFNDSSSDAASADGINEITSVALESPPKVRFTATTEMEYYVMKQNSIVIRHASGDRVVALLEIASPGNKSSRHALRTFVEKAAATLFKGYHLLIVDLHPPGPRDPQGIHGAIWEEIADASYRAPQDKPLTLAAYSADVVKTAFVEPIAVGDVLPDMPLFLKPEGCVHVPLEATYNAAWRGVPRRWQRVLETANP